MTEEEKLAQAKPKGGTSAVHTADEAARTGVGLDLTAVEASMSATVRAAQWLLGTAGALVPVIVAGVQITRLGDVAVGSFAFWLSIVALAAAATSISAVLVAATRVLRIPYADLSDVSRLRRIYFKADGWKEDFARRQWDRTEQSISAATGGRLAGISALHDELQTLRASNNPDQIALTHNLSEVARIAVAIANRLEIERRFTQLRTTYIIAVVVVLAAVTAFVATTVPPPGRSAIQEPVAVRVFPRSGIWPEPLGDCAAGELLGAAVSGRWPTPDIAVASSEGCEATLIRDATGLTILPIVHDVLLPSRPSG